MVLKNPNKDIRTGIGLMLAGSGIPVYNKRVPITVAVPTKYILVTSQGKQEFERDKKDFEWECTFNIDIFYRAQLGTDMTREVDDIEESIESMIYDIVIPNWQTKNIKLEQSTDLDTDTTTHTIHRRVLTFTIWLWR